MVLSRSLVFRETQDEGTAQGRADVCWRVFGVYVVCCVVFCVVCCGVRLCVVCAVLCCGVCVCCTVL